MNRADKKILHLILKKEFFDQIKSGEKTSEFREFKAFWIKRLMQSNGSFKHFDLVHFRNGYHKDAPTLLLELKEIKIISNRISWFSTKKVFEIVLGDFVEH